MQSDTSWTDSYNQHEASKSDIPLIKIVENERNVSGSEVKSLQSTHSAEAASKLGDSPMSFSSATIGFKIDEKQAAISSQSEEDESMSDSSSNSEDALDEFIINPRRYQDRLAELLENTTRNSSLFTLAKEKSSVKNVEAALNSSITDFLSYSPPQNERGMNLNDISLFVE